MAITRRLYLFVATLFMFWVGAAPVEAQDVEAVGDVVCGWCRENNIGHGFDAFGEGCGGSGMGAQCSRCGGTSTCHYVYWPGACHILCGPDGDAQAALTEIREALASDDVTAVASALLRERAGVSVEFLPEGGRIDLLLPCDLTRPFSTIPVLPALRVALQAELQRYAGRAATHEARSSSAVGIA